MNYDNAIVLNIESLIKRLADKHIEFIGGDDVWLGIGTPETSIHFLLLYYDMNKSVGPAQTINAKQCVLSVQGKNIDEWTPYSLEIGSNKIFTDMCKDGVLNYLSGTLAVVKNKSVLDNPLIKGTVYTYLGI